jgi:hypothetical protein
MDVIILSQRIKTGQSDNVGSGVEGRGKRRMQSFRESLGLIVIAGGIRAIIQFVASMVKRRHRGTTRVSEHKCGETEEGIGAGREREKHWQR